MREAIGGSSAGYMSNRWKDFVILKEKGNHVLDFSKAFSYLFKVKIVYL